MSSVKKPAKPSKLNTPIKFADTGVDQVLDPNTSQALNQLILTASIAEAKPLRYTPAGIPALNLVLEHESDMVEGGVHRQVKLTLRAVAFGALADKAVHAELGKLFVFSGFLINARTSKSLVFHIQDVNLDNLI